MDSSYPGGLRAYIERSRKLLLASKNGDNPLDNWVPSVPHGVELEPFSPAFDEYAALGRPKLGRVGFVLVAGGLGERLGYSGLKVALPSETTTGAAYLQLYCSAILAFQTRYGDGRLLPLAIMVSDDTAAGTRQLLQDRAHFGLRPEQVTLLKQEKVAALLSVDAKIAQLSPYEINSKPHGHGDVHSLMHSSGTAARWLEAGLEYVAFFQDTNGLNFLTLEALLGVSERLGLEVNSLAVPRVAKQAVGAITRLTHTDGRVVTVNVE